MKRSMRHRGRAGSAILEFALGSIVLVPIFTGAFQYGYIFYQYNALENAVANGAHYAALRNYTQQCSVIDNTYSTAVKNMVAYGDPTGTSTTPVVPGFSTNYVSVSISPTQTTCPTTTWTPSTVNVSIGGYTNNGNTSYFKVDALFGSYTFSGKPSVTYAYQGIYSP